MEIMVNAAVAFKGVIVKELNQLNLQELKEAYRVRLVENNSYPNSSFKKFIDNEMVAITERIKLLKTK